MFASTTTRNSWMIKTGDVQIFTSGSGSWLGVGVTEVSPEKMKALKLAEERGALLGKIVPDSPASKAGLRKMTWCWKSTASAWKARSSSAA